MTVGLYITDGSREVLYGNRRLNRQIGTIRIEGGSSGTVGGIPFNEGSPWWAFVPDDSFAPLVLPDVTVSSDSISWSYRNFASFEVGTRSGGYIYYGTY